MSNRSHSLLEIRPVIPTTVTNPNMGTDERFQNKILLPIIKMQNPLLILAFRNYIAKYKNTFYALGPEKRLDFIENSIQKDIKFKIFLKGVVVGQFTEEEYEIYVRNLSALNKRITKIIIECLKEQVQLFGPEHACPSV